MSVLDQDILARLEMFGWTEVVRVPQLGPCWEWNGSRQDTRGGYGQLRYNGTVHTTHRLAYRTWVGDIPAGLNVLHDCDNPPCMRPAHLFCGTHLDNAIDKVAKGRGVNPIYRSDKAPAAKLTPIDVVQIRKLLEQGVSLGDLGRQFHVTKQAIWRIKKGQTWTTAKMTR